MIATLAQNSITARTPRQFHAMIYQNRELPSTLAPLLFLGDFIHVATGPKVQVFTSSGTYTPSAGLVAALIECVGGGGAGGGVAGPGASNSGVTGGGGG